jgi:hypothetical protein
MSENILSTKEDRGDSLHRADIPSVDTNTGMHLEEFLHGLKPEELAHVKNHLKTCDSCKDKKEDNVEAGKNYDDFSARLEQN